MDASSSTSLADSVAAAHEWWREAGVDLAFTDTPQAWLTKPRDETDAIPEQRPAKSQTVEPPPRPFRVGGEPETWPADLESFKAWWLAEASLDAGGTFPRVPPRGPAGAPLAVLVPMPEAEDRESLLSGPQGRLIASIAGAMGLAADALYVASALPRHIPAPDWAAAATTGVGEIIRHHLFLAAPQRLLVLGRDVLPLLGHSPAQPPPLDSHLSIQDGQLPLLPGFSLARLLEQPKRRAELWQQWLAWTGD